MADAVQMSYHMEEEAKKKASPKLQQKLLLDVKTLLLIQIGVGLLISPKEIPTSSTSPRILVLHLHLKQVTSLR